MVKMKISIPKGLKKEMNKYPDIDWSNVVIAEFKRTIQILKELKDSVNYKDKDEFLKEVYKKRKEKRYK